MKYSLILWSCLIAISTIAQNTVGVLSFEADKVSEGYNLIYPNNQPDVFLLNNCGEIVHKWEDDIEFRPGNIAYLRTDGSLVKCKRHFIAVNDPIWAGGGGAIVEIRAWDNSLLWSFEQNDETKRLHHDIAPMPNGNILMISWELKSEEEAIEAGRDPATLSSNQLWPDYVLEVNPTTDEVVWEWHAWDHLIQDFDPTKANYGNVAAHPELIDINWATENGVADWMHSNSIDYNEELDQILLSVPTFNEVWIIDHSTTTEEAAGHSGGQSGKGGDLLYRWGNPAAYRAATSAEQTLFYPHDIHWIDDPLSTDSPYFGQLAVFNNRVDPSFSTVNIFAPPFDPNTNEYTLNGNQWGPEEFTLTAQHPIPEKLFSTTVSSVQLLPNDNLLICSGRKGYSFELTPENEVVWEYITPFDGPNPVIQGDSSTINNLTFRFKRYPSNYMAFEGRDLSPQGFVEFNPDTTFCDFLLTPIAEQEIPSIHIFPNPAQEILWIETPALEPFDLKIRSILGQLVYHSDSFLSTQITVSDWTRGVYVVYLNGKAVQKLVLQ